MSSSSSPPLCAATVTVTVVVLCICSCLEAHIEKETTASCSNEADTLGLGREKNYIKIVLLSNEVYWKLSLTENRKQNCRLKVEKLGIIKEGKAVMKNEKNLFLGGS